MKVTNEQVTSVGVGLGAASFLVLMVLKVLGLIDLGWFWVLSSILWVPVATFGRTICLWAGFFFLCASVPCAWGTLFGPGC